MNLDKQLTWDVLSGNYASISHAWGKKLLVLSQRKNKQAFHNRANKCMLEILSWPVDARCRTVKTWLSHYQLPLDPKRMDAFDDFHITTGAYVVANARRLTSYD